MKPTNKIYYTKFGKVGYLVCLIDFNGILWGNSKIPPDALSEVIEILKDNANDNIGFELETEVIELNWTDYTDKLEKALEKLENYKLERKTIIGVDPTNTKH